MPGTRLRGCTPTRLTPLALLLGFSSVAAQAQTRYESAPVLEARPIYQLVEVSVPEEQCWEEEIAVERYSRRGHSRTPAILGTIIGGALGNAVGNNKSSKRVGTVVGAVLGHSVGRDIVRNSRRHAGVSYQVVQRCETVYQRHEEERLVGYRVTYLYNGEEYSVRSDSDPGEEIRIRVNVQPVL